MTKGTTKRFLTILDICLIAILVGQLIYIGGVSRGHSLNKGAKAPQPAAVAAKPAPQAAPATAMKSQAMPVSFRPLNLALIRGGFTSPEQFYQHVQADPVLRSFYGSCTDSQATLKPLSDDILVFSTFRRGDTIKWSRRPLLVHAGEYVYTFCGKTVLARCGNLVSWSPMQPSEDVPPSLLEVPTEVVDPPAPVELASARAADAPGGSALAPSPIVPTGGRKFFFIPPIYIPSGGGSSHGALLAPVTAISGDEFDGHQALYTLLAGLLAIALLKLAAR